MVGFAGGQYQPCPVFKECTYFVVVFNNAEPSFHLFQITFPNRRLELGVANVLWSDCVVIGFIISF